MKSTGPWALITGSSSGLGASFAKALATRGHSVLLTARSEEPMARLGEQLRTENGVQAKYEAVDLSIPGGAELLVRRLDEQHIVPDVLINNAGFGLNEQFIAHNPERLRAMIQLNVVALTELSHILGRRMAAAKRGHILLVASIAAYQPDPLLAAYGASKAYVLSLGEALNVEFAPFVGVTVLSPGLMDTGFNAASGYQTPESLKHSVLPPAKVAEIGLDAMFAGKPSVVAGRLNRIMTFSTRFVSRRLSSKLAYRLSGGGPMACDPHDGTNSPRIGGHQNARRNPASFGNGPDNGR